MTGIDREALFLELSALIEQIHAFKPVSTEDLSRWYAMARNIQAALSKPGGLASEVPSILWHYLSDADIRFKDGKYASMQDAQIRLLLRYLKRNEIPSNDELREYS